MVTGMGHGGRTQDSGDQANCQDGVTPAPKAPHEGGKGALIVGCGHVNPCKS
jgi:hypothetical protein